MSSQLRRASFISNITPWSEELKKNCGKAGDNFDHVSTICNKISSTKQTIANPVDGTITNESNRNSRIPARFVFTLMSFLGFTCAFAMRYNLSIAMVAMVKPQPIQDAGSVEDSNEVCLELIDGNKLSNSTASSQRGEFDWDSKLQHIALGSFYFGYVALQIPGGIMAEKYYAKHFFGVGILITAVFTLLTPLAARHSLGALAAARVIQGLGQAATWPAMNTLIGRWVPIMERSRVSAIVFAGCTFGSVIAFAVSGILCDSTFLGGWPSVFYVFGAFGCLWYVCWNFLVFESPEEHPHITKTELSHIRKGQSQITLRHPVPWRSILTSLPFWSLMIAHFGQDWGIYTLLTETPIYLDNVLHFDLNKIGFFSALPNIANAIVALLASVLTDVLRKKGYFSITTLRKLMNSIGFYGPALCVLLVTYVGCSPTAIIILLSLAVGLNGFVYSGYNVTHVDMSPEFAGTLMAMTNSVANLTGFSVPVFVGWIISDGNPMQNWGIVFMTAFGVLAVSGTIYNIFCSAELQDWKPPGDDVEGNKKGIFSHPEEPLPAELEAYRHRRLSFIL